MNFRAPSRRRSAAWAGIVLFSLALQLPLADLHGVPRGPGAWVEWGAFVEGHAGRILLAGELPQAVLPSVGGHAPGSGLQSLGDGNRTGGAGSQATANGHGPIRRPGPLSEGRGQFVPGSLPAPGAAFASAGYAPRPPPSSLRNL